MSGELLLSESGAGIPPRITAGADIIEPDEPTDADLFWSLYNQPMDELSGIEAILDKHNLPPRGLTTDASRAGLKKFTTTARRLGLIQEHKLSLRQYIGAILP